MSSEHETKPRSVSRGREPMQSSGRGGLGNIRPSSTSRDSSQVLDGPDDFSPTRGREPVSEHHQPYSTGRGGAGNVRSPSREPSKTHPTIPEDEQDLIRRRNQTDAEAVHSTGRGGLGNINRSRSRSRDAAAHVHSSGRGGLGNIKPGDATEQAIQEETERKSFSHGDEGPHATGRGGAGNITSLHAPEVEVPPAHAGGPHSTGRGGTGNIHDSINHPSHDLPRVHSSGRGGYGNIQPGDVPGIEQDVAHMHIHDGSPHVTARGGAGNITMLNEPDVDRPHHHEGGLESSGRGGIGNIRDHSRSREPPQ
jgi:hypothetical protein